jgi:hypothetical protein
VEDAFRVGGREPPAKLAGDVDDLFGRQAADALDQRRQILAPDQFHREKDLAIGLAHVEDAAHRRMRDLPRQPDLVQDPGDRTLPGGTDEFEGDRRPQHEIIGVPHLAHAALADARDHPVAAGKHLAGGKPRSGAVGQGRGDGAAARTAAGAAFLVVGEQRLHFLAQPGVGPAGFGHEGLAFRRGNVERLQKDILRAQGQRRHFRDSK